jgi:hypothetical protein
MYSIEREGKNKAACLSNKKVICSRVAFPPDSVAALHVRQTPRTTQKRSEGHHNVVSGSSAKKECRKKKDYRSMDVGCSIMVL